MSHCLRCLWSWKVLLFWLGVGYICDLVTNHHYISYVQECVRFVWKKQCILSITLSCCVICDQDV